MISVQIMKLVFFLILFVVFTSCIQLDMDSSINLSLNNNDVFIPIKYMQNQGDVTIRIQGLPEGLIYQNKNIIGSTTSKSGYYPILIEIEDSKGNIDSKITVLKIGSQQNSQNSISQNLSTATSGTDSIEATTSTQGRTISSNRGGGVISSIISQSNVRQNNLIPNTRSNADTISSLNNFISASSGANSNSNTHSSSNINNILNRLQQNSASNQNSLNLNINGLRFTPDSSNTRTTTTRQSNFEFPLNTGNTGQSGFRPSPSSVEGNTNIRSNTQSSTLTISSINNDVTNRIRTRQAPRSQTNRNTITEDDIRSTAIFQRQMNSNKAIANLLDIVDQLRANVRAAEGDRSVLQRQLRLSINVQRNAQSAINQARNDVNRINEAIDKLTDQINMLSRELQELEMNLNQNSGTVTQQQQSIINLNNQIQKYQNKLAQIQQVIQQGNKQLENLEQSIQETKRMVEDLEIELIKKKNQILNIDILIEDSSRQVSNIQNDIDDLKRKLNNAQQRKVRAVRQQNRLLNLKLNAPIQIQTIQNQIRSKNRLIEDLENDKQDLEDDLDDLTKQSKQIENQIETLMMRLNQFKTQTTQFDFNSKELENAIKRKQAQIQQATSNLQFLQGQLQPFQNVLQTAIRQGLSANQQVQIAQQNFIAITNRFQSDNQQLQIALSNLQRARSQKQVADLAMEQLLQERSDSLPYSIIPNGNGFTNPGTPIGNNPSGSALGPFPQGSNQIYNSLITSSSSSTGSTFGGSTVSEPYPFSLYRQVRSVSNLSPFMSAGGSIIPGLYNGNNGITYNGNFNCPNNLSNNYRGTIQSIGNNAITISTGSGQNLIGTISPCTVGMANQPNYHMKIGDQVSFYGSNVSDGIYNIYQMDCHH